MKPNFELPLTGRCQCRKVAYKITSAPLAVYACHCTECQRQSGSAFALSLLAERNAVVITEGKPAVWERQHESGRVIDCVICASCGTRLFHEPRANTKITIVKPGNLDDTRWLFPVGHIWTRSAQPWVTIPPDGANCEAQPAGFTDILQAWKQYCGTV
ncbi:MAG TPA: GFA family protein [Pseudolabrys sp.]|nr:GFA family protein [Pseudolabrys sp.]